MSPPLSFYTLLHVGVLPPLVPTLAGLLAPAGIRLERLEDFGALQRRLPQLAPGAAVLLPLARCDDPAADWLASLALCETCPTIVLLHEGGPRERAALLERGAADVMTPPFAAVEILARAAARWRALGRGPETAARPLCFGRYTLDPAARRLADADGAVIPLTAAESDLLQALVAAKGRPLSRGRLLETTRGRRSDGEDRSIDVLIGRLRRKLETDPARPRLILTERGFGYRLATASDAAGEATGEATGETAVSAFGAARFRRTLARR